MREIDNLEKTSGENLVFIVFEEFQHIISELKIVSVKELTNHIFEKYPHGDHRAKYNLEQRVRKKLKALARLGKIKEDETVSDCGRHIIKIYLETQNDKRTIKPTGNTKTISTDSGRHYREESRRTDEPNTGTNQPSRTESDSASYFS